MSDQEIRAVKKFNRKVIKLNKEINEMIQGFEENNPQAKFICVDSKHVNYPIKLFWMVDINKLLG